MGMTNSGLDWQSINLTLLLAYNGARIAYNWLTGSSYQASQLGRRIVPFSREGFPDQTQFSAQRTIQQGGSVIPTGPLSSQFSVQEIPTGAGGLGHTSPEVPQHVMNAAMQHFQMTPESTAPLTLTQPPVEMATALALPSGGIGANDFCPAPPLLTGRELAVVNPIQATDLTAAVGTAGALVPATEAVTTVSPTGLLGGVVNTCRAHPVAVNTVGALPLIGAAVSEVGTAALQNAENATLALPSTEIALQIAGQTAAQTAGTPILALPGPEAAAGAAGGAAGDTAWSWWGAASDAAGSAYNAGKSAFNSASSAAYFAWDNMSWSTKLGLGIVAAGAVAYLARKYLMNPTVYVENNNYPTFNPTFNNDVHLHFPEGAQVHQTKSEDGQVHYTIKPQQQPTKEDVKVKKEFHDAVNHIIRENRRIKAEAKAAQEA